MPDNAPRLCAVCGAPLPIRDRRRGSPMRYCPAVGGKPSACRRAATHGAALARAAAELPSGTLAPGADLIPKGEPVLIIRNVATMPEPEFRDLIARACAARYPQGRRLRVRFGRYTRRR